MYWTVGGCVRQFQTWLVLSCRKSILSLLSLRRRVRSRTMMHYKACRMDFLSKLLFARPFFPLETHPVPYGLIIVGLISLHLSCKHRWFFFSYLLLVCSLAGTVAFCNSTWLGASLRSNVSLLYSFLVFPLAEVLQSLPSRFFLPVYLDSIVRNKM